MSWSGASYLSFQSPDSTSAAGPAIHWIAWAEFLVASVTVLAIIIGGWWTWKLFWQKRQRYPRGNVKHAVKVWTVENERRVLRVSIEIENAGEVIIKPAEGHVWLQVVRPWPHFVRNAVKDGSPLVAEGKLEAPWPKLKLGERKWTGLALEIEPGETDFIHLDFVVSEKLQTVMIYSHLENPIKQRKFLAGRTSPIGWTTTTVHELDDREIE